MTNYVNLSNWCGAKPIFFNEKTGATSQLMDDVIDWENPQIDLEGLYYYLINGYSSFGKTFVKNVSFSRPWSAGLDNKSSIEFHDFLELLVNTSTPDITLNKMSDSLNRDTSEYQNIIIPMSGGLDSRTIGILSDKKENISAYTYNLTKPANRCHENGIAKIVCNKVGLKHKQIDLKNPYHFLNDWMQDLGFSAQAHGMYHYDFYSQIKKESLNNGVVLTGIVGDAWSGKISTSKPLKAVDLFNFGYSHGQSIPGSALNFVVEPKAMQNEFSFFKDYWSDRKFRMYYLILTKMMLLRFLLEAPRKLKFHVASPFLDLDVCASLLNLPENEWVNRNWQKEWLSKQDLFFSEIYTNLKFSTRNDLILEWATGDVVEKNLNVNLLSKYLDVNFINSINQSIKATSINSLVHYAMNTPKIGGFLRKLGINNRAVQSLNWFNILLPVNQFLQRCTNG